MIYVEFIAGLSILILLIRKKDTTEYMLSWFFYTNVEMCNYDKV